ncbi:jg17311 [Pararge aegeria aegeria]|uniref:Jg17311 protein n=1 Tax=Pararge aegeria aegeria TaxID=348720 RepID=A0A8S4SQ28_9NEOP|nr:jg17311 [Pararge aegeria aegeria]
MPLAKLALGAEGLARDELLAAIGVSKVFKVFNIRIRFQPLKTELQNLPGGRLNVASRLYVSQNAQLRGRYLDQVVEIFNSSVVQLDFEYPTYAADQINSWGRWKEAFDRVENKTFHCPLGRQSVPMMSRTGDYNFTTSDVLNANIIKIPYMGEKASFVIVLPKAREGLSILLSQLRLAPELLDSAMSNMVEKRVELTLPKFRIESQLNLRELYEEVVYIMFIFMSFLRAQRPGHSKEEDDEYMDVIEYIDMTGSIRQKGVEFGREIILYYINDFVTSPLADLIALSKLALGVKGDTLHQLLEAIGVSHQSEVQNS